MTVKLGINGFGRIAKLAFIQACDNPCFKIIAINARRTPQDIVNILKFDTNYGRFKHSLTCDENSIYVEGEQIRILSYDIPSEIPWEEVGVHTVLDCTGKFLKKNEAQQHLVGGAKKVIISAPSKSEDVPTFVYGVNEDTYTSDMNIISAASCTTNALAPVLKVIEDNFGIKDVTMITVHAMTGSQATVDGFFKKDPRAGRNANSNIIPSSTGAIKTTEKVIPILRGKLSGSSIRVPISTVSYIYLTCNLKDKIIFEKVCKTIEEASENGLNQILGYTYDDVVSSDFIKDYRASIVDMGITKKSMEVFEDKSIDFISIATWYDNEWGYVSQMLRLVMYVNGYTKDAITGYYRCLNPQK